MKKILVLALVLSMALTLFTGCTAAKPATPATPAAPAAPAAPITPPAPKYPTKPITMVVSFAAGGASDLIARTIAKDMEKTLGQPIVIENKPGASGSVGLTYVTGSKPDGYTITYIPFSLLPQKKLGVSQLEPASFEFIGQTTLLPTALTVPADAPYNTAQEFVDYAKKNPGKIRIGNADVGSASHIAAVALEKTTGAKFNHIPFAGGAAAITALMGKHIEAVTITAGEAKSGVDAGKLKILAIMSDERSPARPDVPTLKESGIDIGIDVSAWGSFGAPKGTPKEILDVLTSALEKASKSEEFIKFSKDQSMNVVFKNSADFAKFVDAQNTYVNGLLEKIEIKK